MEQKQFSMADALALLADAKLRINAPASYAERLVDGHGLLVCDAMQGTVDEWETVLDNREAFETALAGLPDGARVGVGTISGTAPDFEHAYRHADAIRAMLASGSVLTNADRKAAKDAIREARKAAK